MIKGFITFALITAISLGTVNPLAVQAATINQASVSKPMYGQVNVSSGSTLNVRSAADATSQIVASLPYKSYVMVVGQSGNFYKVQYNTAGNYGYVSKDYLALASRDYYLRVNVSSGNLNMRSDKTTSASIIATIPNKTCFAYISNEAAVSPTGPWYYGVYGNVAGYVAANYVELLEF